MISFLLLSLGFVCSFSSSFRCRVRLFIWYFSCFLRYDCITINFPLRTAFAASHRFWIVVFLFSFVSRYFFFSCFFLILYLFIYLFIYLFMAVLGLLVFVWGLSLVAASGGHSSSRCGGRSSSRCAGLSLSRPLPLWGTGSRRAGSVVVAHRPSCSAACGIFPDQGSNPCPLL